jgi:hypothetical protein
MALEELRLIDEQIGQLGQEMASLLSQHQDAVERLAEVPGPGVDSAQLIIAEVDEKPLDAIFAYHSPTFYKQILPSPSRAEPR